MGWNYRVIEFTCDNAGRELETPYRAIHSVYYDKAGNPDSYSTPAATIGWEADEEGAAISTLDMMRAALDKPVLKAALFKS